MKHFSPPRTSTVLLTALCAFCFFKGFSVVHAQYEAIQNLPRNEEIALFDPHRPTFTCQVEQTKAPPTDAQADDWFNEAVRLDDHELWEEDRDYKRIVSLTRQAAERGHWKAMLNLATLYLEKRDPPHGETEALNLIESAMKLGVPAAYDRMGTYYMNGIGVQGDATRAFAFWQKAAEMGNPQAMAYLAGKMAATWDSPNDGFWANIPVAIVMLECALRQGHGPAAYDLHYLNAWPRAADGTRSGPQTTLTKSTALRTLHQGVKYGCADCARDLSIEFRDPIDLAEMLAPHLDFARAERYIVLHNALNRNPLLRFPNLDRILPLPPTPLPPWNGDKQTLIDAAKGVIPRLAAPPTSPASQRQGRHHVDAAYDLRPSNDTTTATEAPFAGYWKAMAPAGSAQLQAWLTTIPPGLYRSGESFDLPQPPPDIGGRAIQGLIWHRFLTVRHNHGAVEPKTSIGSTREIAHAEPSLPCDAQMPCPATGIWQPWLPLDHPISNAINQPWRQAWLLAGQDFPEISIIQTGPGAPGDVQWHLLEGVLN